ETPEVKSVARVTKPERTERPARVEQPAVPVEDSLVSITAQLQLLRGMQHELNQRVARVHQAVQARDGVMTEQEQATLRRAASDQAELSNLLRTVADQIKFEKPAENKQARK